MTRGSLLSPEQALALIPAIAGRGQLTPITGGLSNQVWRVDSPEGRFLLRLHNPKPANGIDRQAEHHGWQQAASAALAPRLLYWDPQDRFSLSQFVIAVPLSQPQPQAVAALLAAFHTLPALTQVRRDYARLIRLALAQLPTADPQLQHLADLASRWQQQLTVAELGDALCHHDPTAGNLLDDGQRLWLVDFEYACCGAPLFDLAAASESWPLADRQQLLTAYCQQRQVTAGAAVQRGYAAGFALHQLLALLWWLALPPRPEVDAACQRYRASLEEALAEHPFLVR